MRYAICLTLLIVGCSTKTDVHPVGDGRYTVMAVTTSQASNGSAMARAQAVKKATTFCAKKSEAMNTETFDNETGVRSYSYSLVFSCR
jgi:hypothetical protein